MIIPALIFIALTLLTQVGGVIFILAVLVRPLAHARERCKAGGTAR